uniref:hypothetical protein n=2 Tax=uncultured Muribaculum sp. TaxID=1918613 RepID=UPI002617F192
MKRYMLPCLALLASAGVSASTSQLMPTPPEHLSPSTASPGEYGMTSVDLYSGTPSIELPLLTVNAGGGHSWPVAIAYHCDGLKPSEPDGIVGAGWTLRSAGVITASRHDLPDELDYINGVSLYTDYSDFGWYHRHRSANIPFDDAGSVRRALDGYAHSDRLFDDTEPDVFNFSFPGCQGAFFLGEDGEWKVRCNKDVKVFFGGTSSDYVDPYELLDLYISDTPDYLKISGQAYSKSFGRFKIIDEDGTEYTFGGSNESVEHYIPFFTAPGAQFVAGAWHLTKVRYTDGRTLTFSYSTDRPYIARLTYDNYRWSSHTLSTGGFLASDCGGFGAGSSGTYGGNLIMPVYLTGITSDEDSISLEYDTDNSAYYDFRAICDRHETRYKYGRYLPLLEDVVKNVDYFDYRYPKCLEALRRKKLVTMKHFRMHQPEHRLDFSYSEGNRLILTTITDDVVGDIYRFATYEPDQVPPLSFDKSDAWGYYKGYDYASGGSDASCYGMLERIIYPTDGSVRFEYERHDYSSVVTELRDGLSYENGNRTAGGLRIKKIYRCTSENASREFLDKEYFYVKDYDRHKGSSGISSGCMLRPPLYSYSFVATSIDGSRHSVAFSTERSLACHDTAGGEGHVGYSEVAEKNADGSVTVYKFTDFATVPDERPVAELMDPKGIKPCSYRTSDRGLLKESIRYLPDGNLWKRTVYTYSPSVSLDRSYVKCLYLWGDMLCKGDEYGNGFNTGSWIYDARLTHLNFIQHQNFLKHRAGSHCPIRLSSDALLLPLKIPLRS